MRIPTLFAALALLVTLVPATALAHHYHYPCGYSLTRVTGLVHVDTWSGACTGGAVSFREDIIICRGIDVHAGPVHAFVLYSSGCQTGILVERTRIDEIPVLA